MAPPTSKKSSKKSSKKTSKKTAKKTATKKKPVKRATKAPKKRPAKRKIAKRKVVKKRTAKKKAAKKKAPTKKAVKKQTVKKVAVRNKAPAKRLARPPRPSPAQPTKPRRIAASEYATRRRALMSMMAPGSIAVVPGAKHQSRNSDIDFPFRQDSDFHYLTGFSEADAVLVLTPGRSHGEVILFCEERDAVAEQWNGERLGPERAVAELGVDDAFPINDVSDILPGMLEGRERIYVTLGEYPKFDNRLLAWVKSIRAREASGAIPPGEFVALKHLLHEQRLFKSPAELKLMREAARITAGAHIRAMRSCQPGMYEWQLEAELTYEFMRSGAKMPAYPSIVGAGANGCVLHYTSNKDRLKRNDLVLIDAGCEYDHYAADITRTFPVSGQFSKAQQALYEVVLAANEASIATCAPDVAFNKPHDVSIDIMVQGLVDLKIMQGEVNELVETGAYRRFCPHKTSHWLGIDVHDVGDYQIDETWRALEPGMVLTIEPGIYIQDNAQNAKLPARWRGQGIRVEDDVLITRTGCDVITSEAPKSVSDIVKEMRRKRLK